jgi:hypothetical protein
MAAVTRHAPKVRNTILASSAVQPLIGYGQGELTDLCALRLCINTQRTGSWHVHAVGFLPENICASAATPCFMTLQRGRSVLKAAIMGHGSAVAVGSHSQSNSVSTFSICCNVVSFSRILLNRAPAILRMAPRLPPCSKRISSRISSRLKPRSCERLMNRTRSIVASG